MRTHPFTRGRSRLPFALSALVLVTVGSAEPARAQPQPPYRRRADYRLEFHALEDPTCPGEQAFRKDIQQICGHEDVLNPEGRHLFRVVMRKGTFYQATIELFLPDGSRRLGTPMVEVGSTCAHAMREAAVAVVGAMLFEPPAGAGSGDSDSKPAPSSCEEECRSQVEKAEREAYERGREEGRREGRRERESALRREIDAAVARHWEALGLPSGPPLGHPARMPTPLPFAVSASGLISIGFALDVAPGFALGAEWRPIEQFSLGLEARAVLPAVGAYYGANEPKFPQEVSIYSALVSPCARISYFVGCGALDVGGVYAPGYLRTEWALRLAAGPRIGADFPFAERFSVRVMGDLLFPLSSVEFFATDLPGSFVNPVVSGFVSAGLTVGF